MKAPAKDDSFMKSGMDKAAKNSQYPKGTSVKASAEEEGDVVVKGCTEKTARYSRVMFAQHDSDDSGTSEDVSCTGVDCGDDECGDHDDDYENDGHYD